MKIIDLFSSERPEWGVSEAARALGLAKSTTSESMSELAELRLLRHTSGRGRYRLGWRLFELSQTLLDTTEFRSEARSVMEELVMNWGETVHLAVLNDAQVVYVEKLQPTPTVKIKITRSGARLPAHCSGVGKVLLAHVEWKYVAELLGSQGMPALTPNTITTLEGLAEELERVRGARIRLRSRRDSDRAVLRGRSHSRLQGHGDSGGQHLGAGLPIRTATR